MGWNSPRMSDGASGFMSYMSCVAAPPSRYSTITLFAGPDPTAPAARASSARSKAGRLSPPRARESRHAATRAA